MGKPLSLTAKDAHRLGAYRADPAAKPQGGIVVIIIQTNNGTAHQRTNIGARLRVHDWRQCVPVLEFEIASRHHRGLVRTQTVCFDQYHLAFGG